MTDRELLELAAKAAGVDLTPMAIKPLPPREGDGFIGYMTKADQWRRGWFNPLIHDGDALRLAVTLGMLVDSDRTIEASEAWPPGLPFVREAWASNGDRHAATRRAIVRAAAEIGKAMP